MNNSLIPQTPDMREDRDLVSEYNDQRFAEKWFARYFSLVIIGLVLWPIRENWRKRPKDSFPLSYYPMFSARRSKSVKVTYLVGFDEHDQRVILPYKFAGSGGMNQVRRQIRRLVAKGHAERLCQAVAANVERQHREPWTNLVRVQVVTGTYRLNDYFLGKKDPLNEVVHAESTVKGSVA